MVRAVERLARANPAGGDSPGRAAFLERLAELRDELYPSVTAHEQWKIDFERAVRAGGHGRSAAEVEPDDRCPLGAWLHTAGRELLGDGDEYRSIHDLHAAFHVECARILELALAGRRDAAAAALEPGSPFAEGSRVLVEALRQLHAGNWPGIGAG
jgi:hypothetical protein